jgi:electron transfer flavoprotein alpha subunit
MTEKKPNSSQGSGPSSFQRAPRDIWVLAEHLEGRMNAVTYETVAFAVRLAETVSGQVSGVILGASADSLARAFARKTGLAAAGVHTPEFPETTSETLRWTLKELAALSGPPDFLLVPHTTAGWDLAPALAVDLGASCITAVTGFHDDDGPVFTRQAFHGKLIEELRPLRGCPAVITVMPGAEKGDLQAPRNAGPVRLVEITPPQPRTRWVGRRQAPADTTRLRDAEVVVSAGRGVGAPEHLEIVRTLAALFPRGALGASRPLCDMGWLPLQHQVGMTGQTVSPRLYIACGISGAVQHTMGIRQAELIVSINTDPNALICHAAHCCVAEDLHAFLPILIDKIREMRGEPPQEP